MVRRRTATLSLTAAALLAASPLITSCGSPHAGAAAVVGGRTISISALQAQVKQVREAQSSMPQSAQLIAATGDLDRTTLDSMVSEQVLGRAVRNAGLTVTRRDAQQLQAMAEQQAGGAQALSAELLQQYAVAPGAMNDFYREQAEVRALARHLGADLSTSAGSQALTTVLAKTARELHVDVNPRYGSWDAGNLSLRAAPQPWLRKTATAQPVSLQE